MKNSIIYYSVGALLYCPANRKNVAEAIVSGKFGTKYSLAFCLEDTVAEASVAEAEEILRDTLATLQSAFEKHDFYLPKIFIRVRSAAQISHLCKLLGSLTSLLCGFILPKFSMGNADAYLEEFSKVARSDDNPLYIMPILESDTMIDLRTRYDILYGLKDKLAPVESNVLNLRVGGNDLCHAFGFRRHADESIHQIRPVANLFSDIVTVFGREYIISGPVWEYFAGDLWETGLKNEIALDLLMGFTGKTVIHPNQIRLVNESLMVWEEDYLSAKAILNWDSTAASLVSGDPQAKRMNEYNTHKNWAEKIMYLSEYYGVR